MEIIETIEAMRLILGLSKRAIGKQADIDEDYYTKIITGQAPGVSNQIIERLAAAVHIRLVPVIDESILSALPKGKQMPVKKEKRSKIIEKAENKGYKFTTHSNKKDK